MMLRMRTTITLDDDLAVRLKDLAHARNASFKQVVNEAIRRGIDGPRAPRAFVQETHDLGAPLVDLTKAGSIADQLDDEESIRKATDR